jgi:adenine-specific DNA-methyltransferase
LYQEIATYQAFSLDNSASYSNNKTFLIPCSDLYLLALLNSKAVWYFLNHTASKLQGGAYAMQTPYIAQIPIPKASASDRKAISVLAKKCLDAKGQNVELWETEINDRVARLYGLTADEIELIAKN